MTTPSRPPKQPRPTISLPPLPDVRDGEGRRICAVETIPGLVCGDPHRSSGRCTRCYQREYAAARDRLEGRPLAVKLDESRPVTVQLPAKALRELDAHRAKRPDYARSEWVRDAVLERLERMRQQHAMGIDAP